MTKPGYLPTDADDNRNTASEYYALVAVLGRKLTLVRSCIQSAEEWAMKYPLQGKATEADGQAASIVFNEAHDAIEIINEILVRLPKD